MKNIWDIQWKNLGQFESEPKPLEMKLPRAMKKAYRSTVKYQLDKLNEEESKYSRRLTIAMNKLDGIRREKDKLLKELVNEKYKGVEIEPAPEKPELKEQSPEEKMADYVR
jgi:hypothetical protein